jgi:hypothetical protein
MESFFCVMGAARIETAGVSDKRGKGQSIELDKANERPFK